MYQNDSSGVGSHNPDSHDVERFCAQRRVELSETLQSIFEQQENSLIAYAMKCEGTNWLDLWGDTIETLLEKVMNESFAITPERIYETLRDTAIRRRLGRRTGLSKQELTNIAIEELDRPLEFTEIGSLLEFGKHVNKILERMEPKPRMVYEIYLRYYVDIPKTKGKFETLTALVNQDREEFGFETSVTEEEVAKLWRKAHTSAKRLLRVWSRNV